MRKRKGFMKAQRRGKIGWQVNVNTRGKFVQLNLLNLEKRDWQSNVDIKKRKLQMNLLNVGKRLRHLCEYKKEKTRNEPLECREKRLANRHKCAKKMIVNTTVAEEVRKFHAAVSEGPMYICSCCDQLWYQHSYYC